MQGYLVEGEHIRQALDSCSRACMPVRPGLSKKGECTPAAAHSDLSQFAAEAPVVENSRRSLPDLHRISIQVVHLAQVESMSLLESQMEAAEPHYYMSVVDSEHRLVQDSLPESQTEAAELHYYTPIVDFDHLPAPDILPDSQLEVVAQHYYTPAVDSAPLPAPDTLPVVALLFPNTAAVAAPSPALEPVAAGPPPRIHMAWVAAAEAGHVVEGTQMGPIARVRRQHARPQ
jgi:hypothetical protein